MKLKLSLGLMPRRLTRTLALAFVCATAVTGVLAQAPFDPALERELWKTLLPMGGDLAMPGPNFVPVPRRTNINTPSPFKVYSWTDENDVDIYRSVTIPSSMPGATQEEQAQNAFNAEVDLLRDGSGSLAGNEGACTFSHRDDWDGDGPQWRQCVTGGRMLPPPPGALLDPVGVAVDGTTIYVVDDFNQRVQAFDFEGRVKPMKYPIGNGIPGSGTYSYSSYLPYETFPGYETFDGGYSGSQLKAPNGIAVDAAHQIAVADSGNFRIAVFADDGASVFNFPLPEQLGRQMRPTLVAVTPGTTILPPGSAIPSGRENDRIVVTDWSQCMVQIYKSNFELVKALPEALPSPAMHAACKNADATPIYPEGTPTFAGEFSTVTGVTIDQSSRVYVTDHAQNVVQVLDADGNTLGWIGKPGVQPAPGALSGPVGAAIDHLGRVGVIDGGNSRVVFYAVSFAPSNNVPTATFEFQLDTVTSVSDFPMGLAEQWGTAADGLDPKGRFVATDPWGKQILRFELPELGIVDAQAALLAVQPVGQPADQLTGRGTFKVAVPRQKDGTVIDVETFVVPVEDGIAVVPGSIVPGNDQVPTIDIAAGEYMAYEFTYTMNAAVAVATFTISARGDFDGTTYLAEAPEANARARSSCTGCDAAHEIHWMDQDATPGLAEPITNPITGAWYRSGVIVRLLPVPADGSITRIGWHYGGISEIFYRQRGDTQESAIGSDGYIEVPVAVPGATTLTYWAITSEGRIGDPHTVDLNLDLADPSVNFLIWPPPTGTDTAGRGWYNHDVTIGYVATDIHSGTDQDTQPNPALADGQLVFTAEGREQSQTVTITDRVGRAANFNSAQSAGGRPVYIDKSAPTFDWAPANPIVLTVNGEDENGSYATVPPGEFALTATDPSLFNGEPGSGIASVTNPGMQVFRVGVPNSWTYTATDNAGNTRSVTVDVVIQPGAPGVSGPDQTVEYGGRVVLRAYVRPRFATGTVTFAFGPYTVVAPVQTVSGGIDPATGVTRSQGEAVAVIDPVMIDIGRYPMTAAYSGDHLNDAASTQMAVNVTPRAVTITAVSTSRIYGASNPAFTATAAGVISGDTLNYTLSSPAISTSNAGAYDINVNLLDNPNYYAITATQGTLLVTTRPLTVTATAVSQIYGNADPSPLPYSLTGSLVNGDTLSGALMRAAGSSVGVYPIGIGTLTAGGNYAIAFQGADLTITRRVATVTAQNQSKTTDQADPPLTATGTGFLNADPITFSATRAPGSAVGTYVITPSASGAALSNYAVTYVNGVFTIIDGNRPPVCSAAVGGEIWPPNHKNFYAAPIKVTDPEGQAVTILITGIWQDEQIDSTGDGKFSPDGQGVGTGKAFVRAERNGHQNKATGNGRIYEILFRATDSMGASCTGSVIWSVPHNQGKGGTAIDSGVRYDSTGVVPGARNKSQIHKSSPKP